MSNPSILVIDDDFAVRKEISAGLRLEGYDLLFAENVADALDVLIDATPRVVILNLKMPMMDGLEFLSYVQLKTSDPFSVVVLTGPVDDHSAETCYKAGVSAMVKKPFTQNELMGAVQTAIANGENWHLLKKIGREMVATSQQLDVLGNHLQELAQLQRRPPFPPDRRWGLNPAAV